jgi:hypothetical protein
MISTPNFVDALVDGVSVTGVIHALNVPAEQPFKTFWLYYYAATFAVGAYCDLLFYAADGKMILRLPAYRVPKTGVAIGCAASQNNTNSKERAGGFQICYDSTTAALPVWMQPTPVKIPAARIELLTDLACLSSDSDIIKTA